MMKIIKKIYEITGVDILSMKADRNKTIDISIDEGKEYLDKCIVVDDKTGVDTILDKTIIGDMYTVIPFLPEKFVDLLIVDPPYNLNKNFHGKNLKDA
ncbi:MAG: hypothetical protein ACLTXT_02235 [Ruminococcus callidus]